jgi:hypothetical protein
MGIDGMKGDYGEKGDRGMKGDRGNRGEEGPVGPKVCRFWIFSSSLHEFHTRVIWDQEERPDPRDFEERK